MRILVTRPRPQAEEFSQRLRKIGLQPVIEPMLVIQQLPLSTIHAPPKIVLLTSQNAVPALQSLGITKDTIILAVGQKTAEVIQKHGYQKALSVDGDGTKLLNHVLETYPPTIGEVMHISGDKVKIDLTKELSRKGFSVTRKIAYKTIPTQTFSTHTKHLIQNRELNSATFFSRQTAEFFLKVMRFARIDESVIKDMNVYCLSDDIAALFKEQGAGCVNTAQEPSESALVSLINRSLHGSGNKKN